MDWKVLVQIFLSHPFITSAFWMKMNWMTMHTSEIYDTLKERWHEVYLSKKFPRFSANFLKELHMLEFHFFSFYNNWWMFHNNPLKFFLLLPFISENHEKSTSAKFLTYSHIRWELGWRQAQNISSRLTVCMNKLVEYFKNIIARSKLLNSVRIVQWKLKLGLSGQSFSLDALSTSCNQMISSKLQK